MSLLRERLLARLLDSPAISQELVGKLLAWKHPGFSAHVGEPIAPQQREQLETVAAYLAKSPLSLKKLLYIDGQQAVLYRSKMNLSGAQLRGSRTDDRADAQEGPARCGDLVSGRRRRARLPSRWPPSAAQTGRAVFPHPAFMKTRFHE